MSATTSRGASALCANRQTIKEQVDPIAWDAMRKDGAMPEAILLLQDNASKAAIVREMLAQSSDGPFTVEWIRTCAAGLDRLNDPTKDAIAAVLIDLLLPHGQELETFDQIFQASPHIPILVLSNPEHEEVAKQAVQRGAQDYILDNRLDSHSLSKALRNMLRLWRTPVFGFSLPSNSSEMYP